MNKEVALFNMVEQQIRPCGILSQSVLQTIKKINRELFVPAHIKKLAFADLALPLPNGQCMLHPKIDARILQEVNPRHEENVLEVGTGSGYMSALLSNLAKSVDTIEIDPVLLTLAEKNIAEAKITNIRTVLGNGLDDSLIQSEYDIVVFSGALETIPEFALECLKIKGRLAAFIGTPPIIEAKLIKRMDKKKYECTDLFETFIPYLKNRPRHDNFHF